MEKAVTTGSGVRRIPLSDKKGTGDSELTEANRRERTKIKEIVANAYLMEKEKLPWQLADIFVVHNEMLRSKYSTRRKDLKEVISQSQTNKTDSQEHFMFIWNADPLKSCREGVEVNSRHPSFLGNSLMGVHLFRHVDMCLLPGLLPEQHCVQLLLCKVTLGLSRSVAPDTSLTFPIVPTPGYHSHISSWPARDTDPVRVAVVNSQVYIYEFDKAWKLSDRPSQCWPVAMLYFEPKPVGLHCNSASLSTMPGSAGIPYNCTSVSTMPGSAGIPYNSTSVSTMPGSAGIPYNSTSVSTMPGSAGIPYNSTSDSTTPGSAGIPYNSTSVSTTPGSAGIPYNSTSVSTIPGSASIPYNSTSVSTMPGSASIPYNSTSVSTMPGSAGIPYNSTSVSTTPGSAGIPYNSTSVSTMPGSAGIPYNSTFVSTTPGSAGISYNSTSVSTTPGSAGIPYNSTSVSTMPGNALWPPPTMFQPYSTSAWTAYGGTAGIIPGCNQLMPSFPYQTMPGYCSWLPYYWLGAANGAATSTTTTTSTYIQDPGLYYPSTGSTSGVPCEVNSGSDSAKDATKATNADTVLSRITSRDPRLRVRQEDLTLQSNSSSHVVSAPARSETLAQQVEPTDQPVAGPLPENQPVQNAAAYTQEKGAYANDRNWKQDATLQSRTSSSVQDAASYAKEMGTNACKRSWSQDQNRTNSLVQDIMDYARKKGAYAGDRSLAQGCTLHGRNNSLVQGSANNPNEMRAYADDRSSSQNATLQSRTNSLVQNAMNNARKKGAYAGDTSHFQDATSQSRTCSLVQDAASSTKEIGAYVCDGSFAQDATLQSRTNSLVQEAQNYSSEMRVDVDDRWWSKDAIWQSRPNSTVQDSANYPNETGAYYGGDRSWSEDATWQSRTSSLIEDAVGYIHGMRARTSDYHDEIGAYYGGERNWSQDATWQSRTSSLLQDAAHYVHEMRANAGDRSCSQDACLQSRTSSVAQDAANYAKKMGAYVCDRSLLQDQSRINSLVQDAMDYARKKGAYAGDGCLSQDAISQSRTSSLVQDAASSTKEIGTYTDEGSWSQDESLESETPSSSQTWFRPSARERIQQLRRKIDRDEEKLTRLWQFSNTRDWSLMSCLESSGTDLEAESLANGQQAMGNAEENEMELSATGQREIENAKENDMELSTNEHDEPQEMSNAIDNGKDSTVSQKENVIEKEIVADAIKKDPCWVENEDQSGRREILELLARTKCEPSTNIPLEVPETTSETKNPGLDSEQNIDANRTESMCTATTQELERESLSHTEKHLPLPDADSLDDEKDESRGEADATETQVLSSRNLACDATDDETSSMLSENQDISKLDLDLDVVKDSDVDVSSASIKSQYTFPPIELFPNSPHLSDDTFKTLDQKVCRLYRKFMCGYRQWKMLLAANRNAAGHNKKLNGLEIQLAKMHISVECHVAFLEASNMLTPLPLSSWQRGELMTIEGQQQRLHATRTQQPERMSEKQYTSLIQSMLDAKESILKATFLPPLPEDSPGNDASLLHQLQTQFADSNTDCRTSFLTVKLAALERHNVVFQLI